MVSPKASRWPASGALTARVVSAALLLPIIFLAVWAGSAWFALMVTTAALLGLKEFYSLVRSTGLRPTVTVGVACTVALIATALAYGAPAILPTIAIGALIMFLWILARRQSHSTVADWALSIAGPLYLGVPLVHAVLLRQGPYGMEWVLLALTGTFAYDTGAYLTGRALGRHKMAPSFSPGKTWEGAAGGLACAVASTTFVTWPLGLPVSIWQMVILGVFIGVAAQLGDLVESVLKRAARTKEAGHLMPGHGGILDRLDSIVFTTMVVYYFVRGVVL